MTTCRGVPTRSLRRPELELLLQLSLKSCWNPSVIRPKRTYTIPPPIQPNVSHHNHLVQQPFLPGVLQNEISPRSSLTEQKQVNDFVHTQNYAKNRSTVWELISWIPMETEGSCAGDFRTNILYCISKEDMHEKHIRRTDIGCSIIYPHTGIKVPDIQARIT